MPNPCLQIGRCGATTPTCRTARYRHTSASSRCTLHSLQKQRYSTVPTRQAHHTATPLVLIPPNHAEQPATLSCTPVLSTRRPPALPAPPLTAQAPPVQRKPPALQSHLSFQHTHACAGPAHRNAAAALHPLHRSTAPLPRAATAPHQSPPHAPQHAAAAHAARGVPQAMPGAAVRGVCRLSTQTLRS